MSFPTRPRSRARRLTRWAAPLVAALSLVGLAPSPAQAVTYGELDGNRHPGVVLVLMEVDGAPAFRCSGTLISPTVVLTAGHCTGEPGEFSGMRVFAESDVQSDTTYPGPGGPNTVEATAWHTFPGFTEDQFFLHDVGVIQLAKPITLAAGQYGQLPAPNALDALKPSRSTTFTAVGYGLQRTNNNPNGFQLVSNRVRMLAHPQLLQINTGFTGPQSLLLSNNAHTGGTCFGDSGGPTFKDGYVVTVTSYGYTANCRYLDGLQRVDIPVAQAWLATYGIVPAAG